MDSGYSVETCKRLQQYFEQAALCRPMRLLRYEPGTQLEYDITTVEHNETLHIKLLIHNFVGGGFAGQVYKVELLDVDGDTKSNLQTGGIYALKIFVPPSNFGRLFRNLLYTLGFQGHFAPQVNPAAAMAGALWQKFIRRAAQIKFADRASVNDVHAILVDRTLGSCGEISDWIDGRTWRLEVDDRMDWLRLWRRYKQIDERNLGSPEYRAKNLFMRQFVELLHELGAYEFARQYEWWTCKSQPNCLKLKGTENEPDRGLVAVDFRAGLTLLPFLPMSPADFKLIYQGIKRGSLVQFDRGSVTKLKQFVQAHSEQFNDMMDMLGRLNQAEQIYRDSLVDVTHNHVRLFYDRRLWSTIFDSCVTSWQIRNLVDDNTEQKLRKNKLLVFVFALIGIIPFLGKILRRFWARPDWRRHYISMLTSWDYLSRAVKAKITEKAIHWHRSGRINATTAEQLAIRPMAFFYHLPFSLLPASLHRFLTDWQFFTDRLHYIFVRPFKLYFNAQLREQWLRDMVEQGKSKHILTDEDAQIILSQIGERYIQRYLISLVVHLLTLPVTQIVSVIVAAIYYHRTGDELGAGGILVLFQVIPVSPGSLCRGLYAVGIALYDRSFRDYNIAVFLSFFKYIGYLAFPIQMAYRYPALARFMASHWATEAVHIVPVFGERGALLEHGVFCLFYNWPLTIRRRIAERMEQRARLRPRYWHIPVCAAVTAALLSLLGIIGIGQVHRWLWLFSMVISAGLCGSAVTLLAGGARLWQRFVSAAVTGLFAGLFCKLLALLLAHTDLCNLFSGSLWLFALVLVAAVGAIITELLIPSPQVVQFRRKKLGGRCLER